MQQLSSQPLALYVQWWMTPYQFDRTPVVLTRSTAQSFRLTPAMEITKPVSARINAA